jgi:hypothetical protein
MNEQRSVPRRRCPSGPRRQLFLLGSEEVLNASVTDVSAEGIAVLSDVQIEPGTYLVMEILSPGQPRRHMELVQVVHREFVEDGRWHIGCSFVEKFEGHPPAEWACKAERELIG